MRQQVSSSAWLSDATREAEEVADGAEDHHACGEYLQRAHMGTVVYGISSGWRSGGQNLAAR